MDLLLLLLCAFACGFAAGELHGYYKIARIIREVAEEHGFDIVKELGLNIDEKEKSDDVVYKLQVETHNDMLYLFNHDTDEFICQGSSVQELAKLAKEYKKVLYAAVKHGDKIFAFKDGISVEVEA